MSYLARCVGNNNYFPQYKINTSNKSFTDSELLLVNGGGTWIAGRGTLTITVSNQYCSFTFVVDGGRSNSRTDATRFWYFSGITPTANSANASVLVAPATSPNETLSFTIGTNVLSDGGTARTYTFEFSTFMGIPYKVISPTADTTTTITSSWYS